MLRVAIANGLELELAVEADKPTRKAKEEFRKRRVHIEVVFPEDVVRREFAKVDFVEPVPILYSFVKWRPENGQGRGALTLLGQGG